MKRALIAGVSGQDGSYLAQHLLSMGYEVHGTSRDAEMASFSNPMRLGIRQQVTVHSAALNDFRSVFQIVQKTQPDEIYNLSGQSSVGLSFGQPVETLESIAIATLNLLEVIRLCNAPIRFYNAASSECFGDVSKQPADEVTPFHPRSPYAMAKATSFWEVANYREAYGLYACSGLLFNHESPLRPQRFVTKKVVAGACRMAAGDRTPLVLGDLSIQRDWGWAPEYVVAMHRMLQMETPEDFVVCTGHTHSLEEFVQAAFSEVGLDWRKLVRSDPSIRRPSDIHVSRGNPKKAKEVLGWEAQYKMADVVRMMVKAQIEAGDHLSGL